MILLLLLLGGALLTLPGLRLVPPRRLPLNEWIPVATVALVVGFLVVELSLVFIALPTVLHAVGLSGVIDTCHDVLAPLPTDPSAIGWLAGVLAVAGAWRFTSGIVRARAAAKGARVDPWLGRHVQFGDVDLVVVPVQAPLAFGVPGDELQVVVSDGLVDRLKPDELQAVVLHEAAHQRLGHARYLQLLVGVERALGVVFVARSVRAVREGLEAWADSVLAERFKPALEGALAVVSEDERYFVADRVNRLRTTAAPPAAAWRAVAYAPVAIFAIAGVLLVVGWLTDAQHALALGWHCTD